MIGDNTVLHFIDRNRYRHYFAIISAIAISKHYARYEREPGIIRALCRGRLVIKGAEFTLLKQRRSLNDWSSTYLCF